MKIQIRQPEIQAALKDYIAKQGINLQGKDFTVEFTSGRKGTGLIADIDISESTASFEVVSIPVVSETEVQATPSLTEVIAQNPETYVEKEEKEEVVDPSPSSTTSLFG